MAGSNFGPGDGFGERRRLIRFRMRREKVTLADEIRLIPRWLFAVVGALYLVAVAVAIIGIRTGMFDGPESTFTQEQNILAVIAIITAAAIPIGISILMVGYVNQDARRREMNATLWTVLVIMLLPGWLLMGFVIYFLVRLPLPYHCTGCGALVSARYNYCPGCRRNLRPACVQCRREVSAKDRYCPYCGSEVPQTECAEATDPLETRSS